MKKQNGQALIIVIFAIALAITIFSSAIISVINLNKNARLAEDGFSTLRQAEAGAEYALLKLVRNPNACSNLESFSLDSATITINFSQSGTNCTILVTSQIDTIIKKVQVQAIISGNLVSYTSWKEMP